ncbi:hypothetical protein N7457_007652 [Penicillium paradoxum]|uniref:uncharacterized protein n=1 Tax=Penicillium paradoxum TaxID=176176 RepID=UPI002547AB11|nr:uncharacterized protein N7457_007652 [Penicillium paradoxum]KAJ5772756.1 hypothetical protein N7457_007652 [Penicillium paradoxum]
MHLSFCVSVALGVVPLRSWSMIHTVLSSTLLLCIWKETRNDPECRDLQKSVIDVFSSLDSRTTDEGDLEPDNGSQWLSARHILALITLRAALGRQQPNSASKNEALEIPGLNGGTLGPW